MCFLSFFYPSNTKVLLRSLYTRMNPREIRGNVKLYLSKKRVVRGGGGGRGVQARNREAAPFSRRSRRRKQIRCGQREILCRRRCWLNGRTARAGRRGRRNKRRGGRGFSFGSARRRHALEGMYTFLNLYFLFLFFIFF